jgi:hypothetical protein
MSPLGFAMNNVRAPVAVVAGTDSVKCRIPSPRGSRSITVMSGVAGPLTEKENDVDNPLTENTHKSALPVPEDGR